MVFVMTLKSKGKAMECSPYVVVAVGTFHLSVVPALCTGSRIVNLNMLIRYHFTVYRATVISLDLFCWPTRDVTLKASYQRAAPKDTTRMWYSPERPFSLTDLPRSLMGGQLQPPFPPLSLWHYIPQPPTFFFLPNFPFLYSLYVNGSFPFRLD